MSTLTRFLPVRMGLAGLALRRRLLEKERENDSSMQTKFLFDSLEIGADYLWTTHREDIDKDSVYVFRLRSRRLTEGRDSSCEVSGTFFSIVENKKHPDFGKPRGVCLPAYHHSWNEITSALPLWEGAAPQASASHAHFYCHNCDEELDPSYDDEGVLAVSPCCYDNVYEKNFCDGGDHDETCLCVTCKDARLLKDST